jgi:pimeloyl-ACP methyl ester carboxylesterase
MELPHLTSLPPIWREPLVGLELARLLQDPIYREADAPEGRSQPVLLIPGFLAGDGSLSVMTRWLRRTGHWTSRAGIRANVDCSEATVDRLSRRLERFVERRGDRAVIIGQSRGGTLARVLAVRHPEMVSGIVTLGSPTLNPFAVHPIVRAQIEAVGRLGTAGAPGLFGRGCRDGDCCEPFWGDLVADFPSEVEYLSIYSRSDGIVDWRACLDPAARLLEVSATHCGMSVNATVYRAVAEELKLGRARDEERGDAREELVTTAA